MGFVKSFFDIKEPNISLSRYSHPHNGSYPKPVISSPYFHTLFKIHFNTLHSSYIWSLSLRVPSQNSVSKVHCLSISSPSGPEVSDELNNSIGQNPSSEAYSSSASQEIPHIFIETKGSLLCTQKPIICPYPKPD
jgi:hypothetical protein